MSFRNGIKLKKLAMHVMSLGLICSTALIIPAPSVKASTQAIYYVDPVNGQDTNDGASTATAFRTIEHARDAVRTINASMTGDIEVKLRGGTYTLDSTLNFTDTDSGTNGHNIIYTPYNGEKPVISSGKQITGWTLYDSGKNIYRAYAGGDIETRQLFVNGNRATRARSTGAPTAMTYVAASGYTATGSVTADGSIPMHQWGNKSDIEFVYKIIWTAPRIGVSSITNNGSTTTITMKQPGWAAVTQKGGTSVGNSANNPNGTVWYVENAYELLDREGEWYLDRSTDYFYYKPLPDEDISTATVMVPTLEELVRVQGTDLDHKASNIQFYGITFSYATELRASSNLGIPDAQNNVMRDSTGESIIKAAVNLKYAQSIQFERDVFEHLGGTGLNMYAGTQDSPVIGSRFTDISGNGIQVGDYVGLYDAGTENSAMGTDTRAYMRNNDVTNSYFEQIGAEYFSATAIAASLPQDMDILHNEIANVPYTGIHVGWGWGVAGANPTVHKNTNIQFNYFHDVMSVLKDGGAIYSLGSTGGDTTHRSTIANNYALNDLADFGALYLDQASDWWNVTNNVVDNAPRYFFTTSTVKDGSGNPTSAVTNNYASTANFGNNGGSSISGTTVVTNGNWPDGALSIMDNAGIESAYQDIKPNQTSYVPSRVLLQDFNAETAGNAPQDWSLAANGGTIQVANIPSTTDKSMKLAKTTTTSASMSANRTFSDVTRGSVELKARAEQTNAYAYIASLSDAAGKSLAFITFKNNGKIAYNVNGAWIDTNVTYTAGTWYTIKIVFDTTTDKYDLYINNVKQVNQVSGNAQTGPIVSIQNGIFSGSTGTMYEDNLNVYTYHVETSQILNQNFNTETTGSAPLNWSIGANGGTIQVADVPSSTNKSMKLNKTVTTSTSMGATRTFSAVTKGSVEVDVRAQQTSAYAYIANVADASGNSMAFVTFKNNGKIACNLSGAWVDTDVTYTAGTWYTIKIVFDTTTDTYDLYVNGVQKLNQQPSVATSGTGDITQVTNGIFSGSVGTLYADNVSVISYQD